MCVLILSQNNSKLWSVAGWYRAPLLNCKCITFSPFELSLQEPIFAACSQTTNGNPRTGGRRKKGQTVIMQVSCVKVSRLRSAFLISDETRVRHLPQNPSYSRPSPLSWKCRTTLRTILFYKLSSRYQYCYKH